MTLRELLSVYNGRQFRICVLEDQKWIFYDAFCSEEDKEKRRKEIKRYEDYKVYEFRANPLNEFEGLIDITI